MLNAIFGFVLQSLQKGWLKEINIIKYRLLKEIYFFATFTYAYPINIQ